MLSTVVGFLFSGILAMFVTSKGFQPASLGEWTLIFVGFYLSYVIVMVMGAKSAVDLGLTIEETEDDDAEDKTNEEK